jgi:hypothetical protein
MKLWGLRSTSSCPLCNCENETPEHLYHCPDQRAVEVWNKGLESLKMTLKKKHTCPEIVTALIGGLDAWQRNESFTLAEGMTWFGLRAAVESQTAIGWKSMLDGFLSEAWLPSQDAYFKWRRKRNTAEVWSVAVIGALWTFAWKIWEHRNDSVHDGGDGLARRTLLREVEEEKAMGGRHLPLTARKLFRKSIEYLRKAQNDYLENWLRRIRAARALAEAGVEEIRPRRRPKRVLEADQMQITRFIRRRVEVPAQRQQADTSQVERGQEGRRKRRRRDEADESMYALERALMARYFLPRNNNDATL